MLILIIGDVETGDFYDTFGGKGELCIRDRM